MKNQEKPAVALLFGGRGKEHAVSVEGAKFALPLIDREKYKVIPVYISQDGEWLIPDEDTVKSDSDICSDVIGSLALGVIPVTAVVPAYYCGKSGFLSDKNFWEIDAAIPLLHGDFGEDGVIQGALDNAKIPYVGCDVRAGAVVSDKGYTKLIAEHMGIPVAKWIYSPKTENAEEARLRAEVSFGYPMFIKPANLGSSVGTSKVLKKEDFEKAYSFAKTLSDNIIIEECIDIDKELECAYFAAKSKEIFTDIGEISCNGGFYDYDAKYKSNSNAIVSDTAYVSDEISKKIKTWSGMLCRFLGIRHLCRIDFFLSGDGSVIFNEINTFPGFTEGSLYPRLVNRCGIAPHELLNLFIEDVTDGCG